MSITREEAARLAHGLPRELPPVHPGEVLLEEFLRPLAMSQNELARRIGVTPKTVNDIVRGQRSVTAEMALRLGRFFGTTPTFWLNLQRNCDLDVASERLGPHLEEIKPLQTA